MLTVQKHRDILILERAFVYANYERGNKIMTANEIELLKLIRENDNPEQALMTAAAVIIDFLKQHESSEGQAVVCLREHA